VESEWPSLNFVQRPRLIIHFYRPEGLGKGVNPDSQQTEKSLDDFEFFWIFLGMKSRVDSKRNHSQSFTLFEIVELLDNL
jgi:hypothetical protein